MNQRTNRKKLLSMVQGMNPDGGVKYLIEYSSDIRGNITIWGGVEVDTSDEGIPPIFDRKKKVTRKVRSVYDYPRTYPYTARILQMEEEIEVSDETLIEKYREFREDHPLDGWGIGVLLNLGQENGFRMERDDEEEVREKLLRTERQDILNLWGVDCPPDINDNRHYGERLNQDRGQVSEWFKEEFTRIGGDFDRLWGQET